MQRDASPQELANVRVRIGVAESGLELSSQEVRVCRGDGFSGRITAAVSRVAKITLKGASAIAVQAEWQAAEEKLARERQRRRICAGWHS